MTSESFPAPEYSGMRIAGAALAALAVCAAIGAAVGLLRLGGSSLSTGYSWDLALIGAIVGTVLGALHVVAGLALFSILSHRWRVRWWNVAGAAGLVGAIPIPFFFGAGLLGSGDWLFFLWVASIFGLAGVVAGLAFRAVLGPDHRSAR